MKESKSTPISPQRSQGLIEGVSVAWAFSSERILEFFRSRSSLVSWDLGHCQPYVYPQITLV
jgi:hypothetical protein